MKFFRNLKLRTKLIISFVFIALLVNVLSFIIPRFSFDRLTNQSVPFLKLTGNMSTLGILIQKEVLEYIDSGQAESVEEFEEAVAGMHTAVTELQDNYRELLAVEDMATLEQKIPELERVGRSVLASHNKTFNRLKELEEANTALTKIHDQGPPLQTDELQQYMHEFNELASLLQLKAVVYVVSGKQQSLQDFLEIQTKLQEKRKFAITPVLVAQPEAAGFIDTYNQALDRVSTLSQEAVDSHFETQNELENLESLEDLLGTVLSRANAQAGREIDSSETDVRTNVFVLAVVLMVVASGFGIMVTRGIVGPVDRLSAAVQQIGAGDLSIRAQVDSHDEIGKLAQAFNRMAGQLQEAFAQAEKQSVRRIEQLEVIANISRQLSTILDIDQALQFVVTQIQKAFGFYHVHIYLINHETDQLIMREGSGEVGRQLKALGHKLQPGQGIVGQVADSGQPLLVSNVSDMPNFTRNSLLPKTQSELAVPLRKGTLVLGVLDMQSEEIAGFNDEDLTLMQTIADQMAVVLENARLFQQAHVVAAEAEALNRRLTLSTWSDISAGAAASGYVFTKSGVTAIAHSSADNEEAWLPVMSEAIQKKQLTYSDKAYHFDKAGNGHNQLTCLSIPLVLRDEVIGVIGIERPAPDTTGRIPWTDDEITTIQQVTEQITLALDAARLANETQRAAWRDRMVGESAAQIWATDEIEDVMRAAVEQLGDRLRASEVVIRLGKEDDLLAE